MIRIKKELPNRMNKDPYNKEPRLKTKGILKPLIIYLCDESSWPRMYGSAFLSCKTILT